MTDINLLRWLAMRTIEKDRDIEMARTSNEYTLPESLDWFFQRHFWIRPSSDDPTDFMSDFLRLRGVESVEIDSWDGPHFRALIEEAFPP